MREVEKPSKQLKTRPPISHGTNNSRAVNHAETALLLSKLKLLAQKASNSEGEEMYVYGKDGIKITL